MLAATSTSDMPVRAIGESGLLLSNVKDRWSSFVCDVVVVVAILNVHNFNLVLVLVLFSAALLIDALACLTCLDVVLEFFFLFFFFLFTFQRIILLLFVIFRPLPLLVLLLVLVLRVVLILVGILIGVVVVVFLLIFAAMTNYIDLSIVIIVSSCEKRVRMRARRF